MKFGLLVVVAIVGSAFLAHFLLEDPGYVVIDFRGYVVEMSVPVLLALLLVAVFLGWLLVKIYRAPRRIGQAAGRLRSGRAGERLTAGLIQIAEGNFAKGEKMLARAASVSDAPLPNYLQAARAAHLLGEDDRRDGWLKQAYEQSPEAANAVLLTQAEFQLDRGQYEPALATLRRIDESAPNHSHTLSLLGKLYFRLEDWKHLGELLPRLEKHGRLSSETLTQWGLRVHAEALKETHDRDELTQVWKRIPKSLREDPELLEAYYRAMLKLGLHETVEKDIAATLKRRWLPGLVRLFAETEGKDKAKQLKRAESWLSAHPEDADLLLTTARLCLKNELWGKARSYLETAISLRPTPEAYHEFGHLLNRLGEADAAADAYQTGLSLVSGSPVPAIPHLEPESSAEDA